MEDRSKRTGAVRPQIQRESDSVLNTTSDENNDELNGETDDERTGRRDSITGVSK